MLACLELRDLLEQDPTLQKPDLEDQDGDVVITLDEVTKEQRYLTVSDRGVGMTSSVLVNYFLRAGASFRRSDVWRQQHESDSGHSRVLRSGRFGVGALAAFLLGDEVEVWTRHVSSSPEAGIAFKASLDSEEIQLSHFTCSVGTTVKVQIRDSQIWERLVRHQWQWGTETKADDLSQWDWYCLSAPSVKRVLRIHGNDIKALPQRWRFPPAMSALLPPWHRLTVSGYKDIHWTHGSKLPTLICNGIIVQESRPYAYSDYDYRFGVPVSEGLSLPIPTVSVFDPDGQLPLNLPRTGLAVKRLPFAEALRESQCEDFVAWALANAPTVPPSKPAERSL